MRRAVLIAALALGARPAAAFYEAEHLELRATGIVGQGFSYLPSVRGGGAADSRGSLRLIALSSFDALSVDAHLVGVAAGTTGLRGPALEDRLTWNAYDGALALASLRIDRLQLQLDLGRATVRLGRQPISLATSYYFTPNDFFSPFDAQAFFRVYKPGVDAARIDLSIGALSELSLYGVLGDELELEKAALLLFGATNLWDFAWSALAGRVRDRWIAGAGFSGDVSDWFGVRGEGHVALPAGGDARFEVSLGVERRFENRLHLRFETFYHGEGASEATRYLPALDLPIDASQVALSDLRLLGAERVAFGGYAARVYSALGAGYELTPLLFVDSLVLFNWIDRSALIALYAAYSLLDDVEAGVSATLPLGPRGTILRPESELGAAPFVFDVELRAYY